MSDQIVKTEAVVAAKRGVYDETVPEINPDGDPLYEVAFRTSDGIKIFWINSYDYYALEVGMHGILTYKGDQLLSFGDYIKENFKV